MFLEIPLKLTSSENFGFCPPTGSNQENLNLKTILTITLPEFRWGPIYTVHILNFQTTISTTYIMYFHLNDGWGYPWAGQTKAMATPLFLMILLKWESSEIWGLLPPIGSNRNNSRSKVNWWNWPEWWGGKALCWANQCDGMSHVTCNTLWIDVFRKFWLLSTNGLYTFWVNNYIS